MIYVDDTMIIACRMSIMNIHGARRAGRRKRKACMGWSWAAACGIQGRGHIARLPAQLVLLGSQCTYVFRPNVSSLTVFDILCWLGLRQNV